MASITYALTCEHAVFVALFDHVEQDLPQLRSVSEVHAIARLVESLLSRHAETETRYVFAALDHVLAERESLSRLYQDHKEIDDRLTQALASQELSTAIRLLREALRASREHFRREEQGVFRLFGELLGGQSLEALGNASMQSYLASRTPSRSPRVLASPRRFPPSSCRPPSGSQGPDHGVV